MKDARIREVVARLERSGIVAVDHWEADIHAIGLQSRGGGLVYVSTYAQPEGRFYCESEGEEPQVLEGATFDELAALLHRAAPQ
jgi:hypothetical protein